MLRFIFRRILQMFPTVLGVIIITFVLFNIVGGSPAAMTLGKNVSPKLLEQFDEQRGFNKPLFFGNWTVTRAYEDADLRRDAGAWKQAPGVEHVPAEGGLPGHLRLASEQDHVMPLAFALNTGEVYRITLRYRLDAGRVVLTRRGVQDGDTAKVLAELPASANWTVSHLVFTNVPGATELVWRSEEAPLELTQMRLRRAMRHFFDSQFVFYLGQLARLDFGVSNYTNQRVSRMLREGIGPSLTLTVPIFIGGLLISIMISLVCAFFRDTWIDRGIVIAAVMLMSLNYLVWIIFGQYLLGYRAGWFPIWGYESWHYLVLPVAIGIFSGLGNNVRFYRTIMLDELYHDYVRTAFAKGVSRRGVLFRHVLKNAMIPVLTNVVIAIPFLYTGSLLLEGFFGIPGLGSISINALNFSDVDVVRAVVFIGAVLYVLANLLTDIAYALVDPRVKLK
ncbi:MAG: ABC transporter permease [Kiritimatiellia bacterium]|nr:ABC transporter permease [Lentisphaerota bacterium]